MNVSDSEEESEQEEQKQVVEQPKEEVQQEKSPEKKLTKKQLAALKKKQMEDDLDAFAELEKNQQQIQPESKEEKKQEIPKEEKVELDENGQPKLSKNQLKKMKKKAKEANKDPNQQQETKEKKEKKKPISAAAKLAAKQQELLRAEQERIRLIQENEERLEKERQAQIEAEEKEKERKRLERKALKEQQKKEGLIKSKKQLQDEARRQQLLAQMGVTLKNDQVVDVTEKPKKKKWKKKDDDDFMKIDMTKNQKKQEVQEEQPDNWEDLLDEPSSNPVEQKKPEEQKVVEKPEIQVQEEIQKADAIPEQKLRSPIICIMGHVDTGKTTLLDRLRNTNVQENEAGGITQQIGATYFPGDKLISESRKCKDHYPVEVKAPGLLIIDTPGHEAFANLRNRGSSLADFAILVIDLMHGLENQTIESLNMLKERKTPFVIALNKIDVCYGWQKKKMASSIVQLKKQEKNTIFDFEERYQKVITAINKLGMNAEMFYKISKSDLKNTIPIVPTSGHSGEGIPDLLSVIIKYTGIYMEKRMHVRFDQFNCTVMEKKMIEGHGYTIDCILIDGVIRKDDHIMLMGFNGIIKTKIRALLTPHPMKEMRVKGEYLRHEAIFASNGVKISAPELEEAVAGSQVFVIKNEDDEYEAVEQLEQELENVKNKIKLQDYGIGVAASTLGSLEALLVHLEKEKVPVSYTSVGPVSRDDVVKALKSVLSEDPNKRKQEFCCMLVFDVKLLPDAQKYADDNKVTIMTANIIYHLTDQYTQFCKKLKEDRQREKKALAIFPCIVQVVANIRSDPLILGVNVQKGRLKIGTPIVVFEGKSQKMKIGTVQTIERDRISLQEATKISGDVAIRVNTHKQCHPKKIFEKDILCSQITRESIDCLKEYFKEQVTMDEWTLIKKKLKPFFSIL